MSDLVDRVRAAHGDAWHAEGTMRADEGGGAVEIPGARLMASGIGHPQWNNGDVHDASVLDLDAARAWYSALGVPWGLRVPPETPLDAGRVLFTKRLMALEAGRAVEPAVPRRVTIRPADASDLERVVRIDVAAFGGGIDGTERWIRPRLASDAHVVAIATLDMRPVGVATVGMADGRAGRTAYVSGVGVVSDARRRGVGRALSAWVTSLAFEQGADLVHLHPDDDDAARLYAGLGFVDAGALDVYVDL